MKRILLIRLGAIGDIVLATAAIEALKKAFSQASVEFLVKERFSGLLEGDSRISRLWCFDEQGRHRGTRGLLSFMRQIQFQHFDLAVDLQDNLRSRMICRCLRAARVLRWDKRAWQRRLMLLGRSSVEAGAPVYVRYLEALRPLGINLDGIRPKLKPQKAGTDTGAKKEFMAMAPGAHWPSKRWPAGHYAELAARIIKETSFDLVLFGSAEDREVCEKIQTASSERIVNLCGQLELKQLVSNIAGARILITNDTGPMHIAEAAGVPVLAFFGPTVRGFGFAPWMSESRVLEREMTCRPCSLHGRKPCRRKSRCLSDISPQEAWRVLKGMLDG